MDHWTTVVLNGGDLTPDIENLFLPCPNVKFVKHDNSGYDIGGYQAAARVSNSDVILFFGATSYIRCPGWMNRVVDSYAKRGPGIYGVMGNRGNNGAGVWPHIRTTGFWLPTKLMNHYPNRVERPDQRYPFEHGQDCITEWVKRQGMRAWVVTPEYEHLWPDWDQIPNGFHRGDQSALMFGDRLTCPPYYHLS